MDAQSPALAIRQDAPTISKSLGSASSSTEERGSGPAPPGPKTAAPESFPAGPSPQNSDSASGQPICAIYAAAAVLTDVSLEDLSRPQWLGALQALKERLGRRPVLAIDTPFSGRATSSKSTTLVPPAFSFLSLRLSAPKDAPRHVRLLVEEVLPVGPGLAGPGDTREAAQSCWPANLTEPLLRGAISDCLPWGSLAEIVAVHTPTSPMRSLQLAPQSTVLSSEVSAAMGESESDDGGKSESAGRMAITLLASRSARSRFALGSPSPSLGISLETDQGDGKEFDPADVNWEEAEDGQGSVRTTLDLPEPWQEGASWRCLEVTALQKLHWKGKEGALSVPIQTLLVPVLPNDLVEGLKESEGARKGMPGPGASSAPSALLSDVAVLLRLRPRRAPLEEGGLEVVENLTDGSYRVLLGQVTEAFEARGAGGKRVAAYLREVCGSESQ